MTSLGADSSGNIPAYESGCFEPSIGHPMSLEPHNPAAVHLAEALRKRVEELSAELATEKARRMNAEATRDELRMLLDCARVDKFTEREMRVRLEEQVAYWQSRCERLEAQRRA